ncbi:hypothetical protein GGI17_003042 [Coemansia sp. S146]|nr:hypothetical protein GGI17_003042 [Coemansia sp. S146]
MSTRDNQPGEPRFRRQQQSSGNSQAQSTQQSKSPRRPGHTAQLKEAKAPRMPSPAQQPNSDKSEIGDATRSSGLVAEGDSEKQTLVDHDLEEPSSKSLPRSSVAQQQVAARYSTEEMLALRNSSLVQPPAHFSPYTPLRPGSQIKLPEIAPGDRDGKSASGHAYIGLENIGRAQKDIVLAPQRAAGTNLRTPGSSQRMFGVPRGSISNTGVAASANGGLGAALVDGNGTETRGQNGYISRNNSISMGTGNARANYSRTGSVAGVQAGVRHSISHDGGRLGATSWRSSGPARVAANTNTALPVEDGAQPEWMADELTYDEGQSARKMQDIEEWKRRMKEGASAPTAPHDSSNDMDHSVVDQTFGMDEGAARGSRFLRMFSAPCAMADGPGGGHMESTLPVPGGLMHDLAAASAHGNGFARPGGMPQQQGDPLSKLFKVFGDKVSVSGPAANGRPTQELPPGLMSQLPAESRAFADPAVEAVMMQMAQASFEASIASGAAPGYGPVLPASQPATAAANTAAHTQQENGARSMSPASVVSGQRLKSASPAPINEALRGIVPTSVFRKSVQSSTASGGPKRPDSTASSNRSATPARNLPSWLVELSRGRSSPTAEQALITNASLGAHDLVDTLERGFPALNAKPQYLDSQSISSLSVQASVGGPSEANAGSVRRGSVDTQGTERLADGTGTNSQAPTPEVLKGVPAVSMVPELGAQPIIQGAGGLHPNAVTSPEQMQMQHGLVPPGMLGMPHQQQQHMLLPGMVPPMGMMPPPHHHHPMGFHPSMMYGMMPPPPPGMFGGMPPVNVPMGQIGGMPGPSNEHQHQQMMLMKMMMSDMPPPGMMFGQMGHPHMYSVGMQYPGMPIPVPNPTEPGMVSGAPQSPNQAFQHQQHQFQHPQQQ